MISAQSRAALAGAALLILAGALGLGRLTDRHGTNAAAPQPEKTLSVQYLEIVTPDMDETCALFERTHGVTFGDPVPEFGSARTAALNDGRIIGVRKPMRANEDPVVRPYMLVDDIDAAIKAAEDAGAEIAIPPMEMPGRGKFAIYILGGIDHGLWEL